MLSEHRVPATALFLSGSVLILTALLQELSKALETARSEYNQVGLSHSQASPDAQMLLLRSMQVACWILVPF